MSVVAIVIIVVLALLFLLFVGGYLGARRRTEANAGSRAQSLAQVDRELEEARAADKGWERVLLEEAARKVLAEERPDWRYDRLDLVLVDDRPGIAEDTAHFLAAGQQGEARIILTRQDSGWLAQLVD